MSKVNKIDSLLFGKIALGVFAILLLLSTLYHFNLTSGIRFSQDLRPDNTMKYLAKDQKEDLISAYSCYTPESLIDVLVLPNEMSRKERDAFVEVQVANGYSLAIVDGIPSYREEGNRRGGAFSGSTYYLRTNTLSYVIIFHSLIDEAKEKEILKGFNFTGGDYTFRYYIGKAFYIVLVLFVITLIAVISFSIKQRKQ